ncbi:RNA ligase, Pab1020 family [Archaeoglobus sulfaticallidus PM70-1]|uniref:RNA ligase, Pab1020 family n=1 Tax=Archaeoglobus sulfaticallidus PM70-1 TaxID=387631 RepID=N0BP55_9EURY|nr:RNA ligase [Archaeoglobus sulfaticallidus]AGK62130.1 RNA ligase, Pab1020 family [Archaeoglobus sulfaticallidus PM70-1]
MKFVAEALHLSPPAAKRLEERNLLREAFVKHSFFHDIVSAYKLEKKFGGFEEGTLIAKTKHGLEVVRGYPKIRRALTLHPTIKKHFRDEVVVEEKMNGYNVRIVNFGSNLYAITRRGFICPYTTEKAREMIDSSFFRHYPELMLCCEVVGKESPFVVKDIYGTDLDFYIFDVREKRSNRSLSIDNKMKIAEEYGFKLAPILERCDTNVAHEVCRDIIERIGNEGREGIVLKDPEMKINPIKYTTSESNATDLYFAFRYFNDYGKDFMLSRLVREAFQSFEFNENESKFKERCERIGKAILESMIKSVIDVSCGREVSEHHRLRFSSLEVLELFKVHLIRMGVDVRFSDPYHDGEKYVLEFRRIMRSTTDKISHHLKGNLW